MGTTVTPTAAVATWTALGATIPGYTYDTSLAYRLVIPGVGSVFAPGDVDPLPDTDFYITSKRQVHHPWIAQAGEGPNAGPDISIGGQKLELPLGRTADGEVQIRVIDVAAPVAGIACGMDVLLAEGNDLLDAATLFADGWRIKGDTQGLGYQFTNPAPATDSAYGGWWTNASGTLSLGGSALFFWVDFNPPIGGQYSFPPWVRSTWAERTFDGTELGGAAWTPGQHVGVHFRVSWGLDSGAGNIFAEANGNRVSFPSGAYDFWVIDPSLASNIYDGYLYCQADGNGEVLLKLGGENYAPACNVACAFQDLEFVSCEEIVTGTDTERYVTSWLADTDARQQMLGRAAYLEESVDGGTTWTRVLYTGYLKQIQLDQSLTYLLTLGDAGRGRRNSPAWSDMDPTADFVP